AFVGSQGQPRDVSVTVNLRHQVEHSFAHLLNGREKPQVARAWRERIHRRLVCRAVSRAQRANADAAPIVKREIPGMSGGENHLLLRTPIPWTHSLPAAHSNPF